MQQLSHFKHKVMVFSNKKALTFLTVKILELKVWCKFKIEVEPTRVKLLLNFIQHTPVISGRYFNIWEDDESGSNAPTPLYTINLSLECRNIKLIN